MTETADVVIVGGGVIGLSIAYNLTRSGAGRVVVCERSNWLGSGSTGRCGAGVRQQWGTEMNCRLAKASIEWFERAEAELDYPDGIEFKQQGYLILAFTAQQVEQFRRNVALQRSLGIDSRCLSPAQCRDIVPYLDTTNLMGGTFCGKDGHINPFRALDAYARAAARGGADIRKGCAVTGIELEGGRVVGVVTSLGPISTPVVVNAAGPWSQVVAAMAGVELPVYSERHQILVTEPVAPAQGPMVISFYHGFYCQQTPHGSFIMGLGDAREPKGFDTGHSWTFLEEVAQTALELLPYLASARVVRQWSGLYNLTPDRQPILGPVAGVTGLYLAVGFSGHGFMLAPVTGEIIAGLITGAEVPVDVRPLNLDRFDRGALIIEPSVV